MGDKKVCDNVCLCRCGDLSVFFTAMQLPPQRGDLWWPHFPEAAAFSQIREAPTRLLSVSDESQMSSVCNNLPTNSWVPNGSPHAKEGHIVAERCSQDLNPSTLNHKVICPQPYPFYFEYLAAECEMKL